MARVGLVEGNVGVGVAGGMGWGGAEFFSSLMGGAVVIVAAVVVVVVGIADEPPNKSRNGSKSRS